MSGRRPLSLSIVRSSDGNWSSIWSISSWHAIHPSPRHLSRLGVGRGVLGARVGACRVSAISLGCRGVPVWVHGPRGRSNRRTIPRLVLRIGILSSGRCRAAVDILAWARCEGLMHRLPARSRSMLAVLPLPLSFPLPLSLFLNAFPLPFAFCLLSAADVHLGHLASKVILVRAWCARDAVRPSGIAVATLRSLGVAVAAPCVSIHASRSRGHKGPVPWCRAVSGERDPRPRRSRCSATSHGRVVRC